MLVNSSSQVLSAISLINLELESNYKTATQLAETYYNKTDTDNLLAGLVTTDYLTLKYADSVDLSLNYYNKTENDNLLANKVSTTGTGDVSISGNWEPQRLT